MRPPPVITGIGFITSIGNDKASVLRSLKRLAHGFETTEFLGNPDLAVKVIGTVKGFDFPTTNYRDWRWPEGFDIDREILRSAAPHGVYADCALQQALADAGLSLSEVSEPGTGLFCASAGSPFMTYGHLGQIHASRGERVSPMVVVSSVSGTLNFTLATRYHIQGAVCGFVSACASSSHALGYAVDEIRLGRQRRMLVVGAEEVNAESVLPFAGMRALSTNPDPDTASRPFDTRRDGFVSTGGAVALVLEDADFARSRSAEVYAEVAGWGQASDGFSVAHSHPEGAGLSLAIRRALADARLPAEAIDYVNAHATSTPPGDRSEAIALRQALEGHRPFVSSTKALTGHGLSLAGAMEAAFCALAIREGFIPGAAHLEEVDPACSHLNLPRSSLDEAPRLVLNNSSGFGGSNVCHLLRRPT